MKTVKSVQIYNSLHPDVSPGLKFAYREYNSYLCLELQEYVNSIIELAVANQSKPSWIRDRQSITYVKVEDFQSNSLELISHEVLSSPKAMLKNLRAGLTADSDIYSGEFSLETINSIWNQIVEGIIWIRSFGVPVLIWHLEAKFLTITMTELGEVKQHAATSVN